MGLSRTIRIFLALVWIAAFCTAILLDARIAQIIHRSQPLFRHPHIKWTFKLPGEYGVTLCIVAAMLLLHRQSWRAAVALLLSGPIGGIVYLILKWTVGRRRPSIVLEPFTFHPFAMGLRGLVGAEKGLSFPSGHSMLAFATATCLTAALPRWGALFFLGGAAVGAERVLENAHYLSDVVAGAGLGVLCGCIALALCARWFKPAPAELEPVV